MCTLRDADEAIGKFCHQVSHKSEVPCSQAGEDCPRTSLYSSYKPTACLHNHYDINGRACQVRVSAFPLRGCRGELLMSQQVKLLHALETGQFRRIVGRRLRNILLSLHRAVSGSISMPG